MCTISSNLYGPRKETKKDISQQITEKRKRGSVILELDANENRDIKPHSYGSMVQEENMLPIFHVEECVPLRFDGKEMIDHMETVILIPQAIVSRGQLPAGIGLDLDHRAIYANICLTHLIGLTP